ncbi:hypothetical protein MKZ38_009092 [Zalerion maritima]|uniref:Uncharacterized protein n=1 Tax=Zalerion maritima TaxID=339359 RepID=A0AAD5S1Y0_9PEZI|nr:hypothetical protein MKZ38_009092 [Zalerion maritima]
MDTPFAHSAQSSPATSFVSSSENVVSHLAIPDIPRFVGSTSGATASTDPTTASSGKNTAHFPPRIKVCPPSTLACEFSKALGCNEEFGIDQVNEWIRHHANHLGRKYPIKCICWYCDEQQFDSPNGTSFGDLEWNFRRRMLHICSHLKDTTIESSFTFSPDYRMLYHMAEIGVVSWQRFEDLVPYSYRWIFNPDNTVGSRKAREQERKLWESQYEQDKIERQRLREGTDILRRGMSYKRPTSGQKPLIIQADISRRARYSASKQRHERHISTHPHQLLGKKFVEPLNINQTKQNAVIHDVDRDMRVGPWRASRNAAPDHLANDIEPILYNQAAEDRRRKRSQADSNKTKSSPVPTQLSRGKQRNASLANKTRYRLRALANVAVDGIRSFLEQSGLVTVPYGFVRVSWICGCRKRLSLTVPSHNLPEALEYAKLASRSPNSPITVSSPNSSRTHSIYSSTSTTISRSSPTTTASPLHLMQNQQFLGSSQGTATSSVPSIPQLSPGIAKYLLLCVNKSSNEIKLEHVDMTYVSHDEVLFRKIKSHYEDVRGCSSSRLMSLLLVPKSMHFVKFELIRRCKSEECIGSWEPDSFPTLKEIINEEYHMNPASPEIGKLPLRPSDFMHYFLDPGDHAHSLAVERLPKKLRVRVSADPNNTNIPVAWGVYIVEGLNYWLVSSSLRGERACGTEWAWRGVLGPLLSGPDSEMGILAAQESPAFETSMVGSTSILATGEVDRVVIPIDSHELLFWFDVGHVGQH